MAALVLIERGATIREAARLFGLAPSTLVRARMRTQALALPRGRRAGGP